jgi:hypothetical protein
VQLLAKTIAAGKITIIIEELGERDAASTRRDGVIAGS